MTDKRKNKNKDKDEANVIPKKEVLAYKYSKKGQGCLYEAIILEGQPCFVTWSQHTKEIKIIPGIEESTRIIRPPSPEEYPYIPYDFADQAELNDFFAKANSIESLDHLYQKVKTDFFQKYVDQDKNIIIVLAADSILTYFQDLFPIIHYSEGIGGNDVGKSSIGYTFEYTGYRVIRGTSISGANYFRILGSVEPGQCTIIEDEADSISEDPDKVRILKAGYEYNAKIPRTNMNTKNQEQNWYYPYGYKMLLGEKSLSEWKAKGLVDRTFTFKCRPGRVRYSIKKVVSQTINKSPELERLCNELLDFRRLMLCYRLIHYEDELPQIKVSLINRDEELSYPLLQLFYGTEAFEEIRSALEYFIKQRRERRSRSVEAALYPILKELITERTNFTAENPNLVNILYSELWDKITGDTGGIKGSLYTTNQYDTVEYGPIYHNTLSKFIGDKFSANLKHKKDGSILTFDKQKFATFDDIYNHQSDGSAENDVTIEVTLVKEGEGGDGSEGLRAIIRAFDNSEKERENTNTQGNAVMPSQPSPIVFIKCPHCKFQNIHQDVIDHHIKYGHQKV